MSDPKDAQYEVISSGGAPHPFAGSIVPVQGNLKPPEPMSLDEIASVSGYCEKLMNKMKEGSHSTGAHYGLVDGIKKRILYKEGGQFLMKAFKLKKVHVEVDEKELPDIETFDGNKIAGHMRITAKVHFIFENGLYAGFGLGMCSTMEPSIRYRGEHRKCPECNKYTVKKGIEIYGGGWYCANKEENCKAKFKDGDKIIEDQPLGKTENIDIIGEHHNVTSKAEKRATLLGVLDITAMSVYFTIERDEKANGDNGNQTSNGGQKNQSGDDGNDKDRNRQSQGSAHSNGQRPRSEKPTKEALDAFHLELKNYLGSNDGVEEFLIEQTKSFREIHSVDKITTVKWLGNLKRKFDEKVKAETGGKQKSFEGMKHG